MLAATVYYPPRQLADFALGASFDLTTIASVCQIDMERLVARWPQSVRISGRTLTIDAAPSNPTGERVSKFNNEVAAFMKKGCVGKVAESFDIATITTACDHAMRRLLTRWPDSVRVEGQGATARLLVNEQPSIPTSERLRKYRAEVGAFKLKCGAARPPTPEEAAAVSAEQAAAVAAQAAAAAAGLPPPPPPAEAEPWYKNKWVWIAAGGAVVVVGGGYMLLRRKR